LIQLGREQPALAAYTEFVPLYAQEGKYPFVYARAQGKDVVLVVLNPAGKTAEASFRMNLRYTEPILLAGKKLSISKEGNFVSVKVPEKSYAIYKLS
jgi:hypothetical protein